MTDDRGLDGLEGFSSLRRIQRVVENHIACVRHDLLGTDGHDVTHVTAEARL